MFKTGLQYYILLCYPHNAEAQTYFCFFWFYLVLPKLYYDIFFLMLLSGFIFLWQTWNIFKWDCQKVETQTSLKETVPKLCSIYDILRALLDDFGYRREWNCFPCL